MDPNSRKSLHKVKYLFKWGAIHKIGNGATIQFWNDVWLSSSPLRTCYPKIHAICVDPHISVAEGAGVDWQIALRRRMGVEEMNEWHDLQSSMSVVSMGAGEDEVI
jgi:hypothetical protein